MLKARKSKKWISILVTLVFLFSLLPIGAAFAEEEVKVTYTTATVSEDVYQTLGYVKFDMEDWASISAVYITVELPSGVVFTKGTVNNVADFFPNNTASFLSGTEADDGFTAVVTPGNNDIVLAFNQGDGQVTVKESAADDIVVKVTAKALSVYGGTAWNVDEEYVLGRKGDAKVTVTAGTPETIKFGTQKSIAKITLTENQKGALKQDDIIELELPSDLFAWVQSDVNIKKGPYGLNASVVGIVDETLKLKITGTSNPFADKLEIEAKITVLPGAPEGEVEVAVSSPTNDDVEEKSVVVAIIGDSDVTITADEDTGSDLYLASEDVTLYDITLESSGTFSNGTDIIITLPEGIEFDADMDQSGAWSEPNGITNRGIFDDKQKLWLEVTGTLDDNDKIELKGIKVNVLPNAELGDVIVEFSGDVEGTVVAGEVISRVDVSATTVDVTVGLDREAGIITLVETGKKALSNNQNIWIKLPNGVEFNGTPKVEVDGKDIKASDKNTTDDDVFEFTLSNLTDTKINTIVISDISLDLDSRVNYGDITVKIGGNALNKMDLSGAYKDEADDELYKVAIAKVVSATARTATFVLGSSSYTVNGTSYAMDVAAYAKNGRTYLPVRYVAYALGVDAENIFYDEATKTVTLLKGTTAVQLTIGSNVLKINGISLTMDVAPEVESGRTMLPFRFIAQALGASVSYDDATKTVTMNLE
ncbi:copper amine oxidase N-terminal domain-containing protein [Moorella sulfitireducens (nom. illeg.)]|uniref:copper amine oxidase N-terminal domain-containing protein n=1 Tax=Neomoorella sulfitireducens TaxID=2972948 RepID=UPI0021ABBEBD|nr:copper amine oxidase N-terminal domain-containing protein [Moorella sulfitireducens]